MQKYYALENKGKTADLYIFGDITSWAWQEKDRDAYGIVKELQELQADEINVHINSYGGEVSEGLAIYNTLKNAGAKVNTYCDGFACSAASVIFMAGDERIMNRASLLMIHNAWSYVSGNADELRKQADDLDKITQASVNAYTERVNITEDEVKEKMNSESWITAEEALKDGFATMILEMQETGINQSAFQLVRERILRDSGNMATEQMSNGGASLDIDGLAERIAEKLKAELKKERQPEKQEKSANWSAFFNKSKKEKEK